MVPSSWPAAVVAIAANLHDHVHNHAHTAMLPQLLANSQSKGHILGQGGRDTKCSAHHRSCRHETHEVEVLCDEYDGC
jgi:hypothetical protein